VSELKATVSILVRRPPVEVFNAFVRPDTITRFWLKSTTGPLAPGVRVQWEFLVPGARETVMVTAFHEPDRIAFVWSDGLNVDMQFAEDRSNETRIELLVSGFKEDAGIDQVVNATEGFTTVLCELKTLLESGRSANLVKDKAELIRRSMEGGASR
jgi:uncharacterized protein YndB with AHSA1/START domain